MCRKYKHQHIKKIGRRTDYALELNRVLFGQSVVHFYQLNPRPGRRLHVVAGDTCLQQVYERPPTSLSSSGDAARVPPWAIAPPGSPTSTQTHTHTRTPHSVPGGKQPGARSAAHPARRGWEGGQTTTTTSWIQIWRGNFSIWFSFWVVETDEKNSDYEIVHLP